MKKIHFARTALAAVAVAGLATNFAAAQELGGSITGGANGAVNSAVNNQVQQRVQGQVQQQVQQQVQAQVQSQMQNQLQAQVQGQMSAQAQLHADVARAGMMAQNAIDSARQQAVMNRGIGAEASVGARLNTDLQAPSRFGQQQNGISVLAEGSFNGPHTRPKMDLPPGLTELDAKVYDAVFGGHNPFRGDFATVSGMEPAAQADSSSNTQIASGWNGNQGVVRANANMEVDLAVRIDSAVHQRRAEISLMRDRALEASNEVMMDKAEQMEKVLDLFIEARAHAAAETRSRMETKGNLDAGRPNVPNPNSLRINAEQNSEIRNSTGATFGNGGR